MSIFARRYAYEQAVKAVPTRLRQRQDDLDSQMASVIEIAVRAGCYDAADWIKKSFKPSKGE